MSDYSQLPPIYASFLYPLPQQNASPAGFLLMVRGELLPKLFPAFYSRLVFPDISLDLSVKLDAASNLSVGSDGCTVYRTEVVGSSEVKNLGWVITNEEGEVVLDRNAENEFQYSHYNPGIYNVVLTAYFNGKYVEVSNKVKIDCR